MSVPGPLHQKMRIYHRYLGFFLLGIMAVYSISGIIMVFRDTDFLKYERSIHKQAESGLDAGKLGKVLGIRNLKVVRQEADKIYFENGTYDVATGQADYKVKEYPKPIEKMTKLHKAKSAEPLFFMNIFFGLSLLFFVISSFWMFMPDTSVFRKGMYFMLAGIILMVIMMLV